MLPSLLGMRQGSVLVGHGAALFCVVLWGVTFISTKMLLRDFSPVEILFYRFCLGFVALSLVYPRRLRLADPQCNVLIALAGLCGVTLYFLLENIALTYTLASNVGVLVATAPFFTGLLAFRFLKGERPNAAFFIGFGVALTGVICLSFNNATVLALNPLGDVLALGAALTWAFYSILIRKISAWGHNSLLITRRVFFFGLLLMLPVLPFANFSTDWQRFADMGNSVNMLFLGLGASALCFVIWNYSLKVLGAVRAGMYIYLVPVVTVLTAALVLQERITSLALAGTALVLLGLIVSEVPRLHILQKLRALQ